MANGRGFGESIGIHGGVRANNGLRRVCDAVSARRGQLLVWGSHVAGATNRVRAALELLGSVERSGLRHDVFLSRQRAGDASRRIRGVIPHAEAEQSILVSGAGR